MKFIYKARSNENWDARANQSGSDFEGFVKDEYRTFTPISGENCVRILPPSPAWDAMCEDGKAPHYGMEVYIHYGVGPEKASVLCLFHMKRQACPICEDRARAERAKDKELARELKATKRVLTFILNRKDEAQGILLWGIPYTVDRDIAKACKDRSTGEYFFLDHPENGYDVYFDREGVQMTTKYTGVALAKRPSSVPEKVIEWLIDRPIPETIRWRTYDEVKRLYDGTGRGEAPDDDDDHPVRDRDRPRREPREETNARQSREPERSRREAEDDNRPRDDNRPPREPDSERPRRAEPGIDPNRGRIGRPTREANGSDDEPPFDEGKKTEPPADPKARAESLRARFGSHSEK